MKPTVIFDVDGTLIGNEQLDWDCFSESIFEITGFQTNPTFWNSLEEVTSHAILVKILNGRSLAEIEKLSRKTCELFDSKLATAIERDRSVFNAVAGVSEVIEMLNQSQDYHVGLATGEWRSPIERKLCSSGLDILSWPLVSSSEKGCRHDAIRSAVELAGGSLQSAVYVGDGEWDLRAARILGIPFVGVGAKLEYLRQLGADYLIEAFSVKSFEEVIDEAIVSKI